MNLLISQLINASSYRVFQGDDRFRLIKSRGRGEVAWLRQDIGGPRDAGSVRQADDLALDRRTEHGAQNLHRHPWWGDKETS